MAAEIQALVKRPDVRRPIAQKGDADRTRVEVLRRKARSDGRRKVTADDGVRADRPDRKVSQMHRAPLSRTQPSRAPEDLAEGAVDWGSHGEHGAVAPIRADGRVPGLERAADTDNYRFLPLAKVCAATQDSPANSDLTSSSKWRIRHIAVRSPRQSCGTSIRTEAARGGRAAWGSSACDVEGLRAVTACLRRSFLPRRLEQLQGDPVRITRDRARSRPCSLLCPPRPAGSS